VSFPVTRTNNHWHWHCCGFKAFHSAHF